MQEPTHISGTDATTYTNLAGKHTNVVRAQRRFAGAARCRPSVSWTNSLARAANSTAFAEPPRPEKGHACWPTGARSGPFHSTPRLQIRTLCATCSKGKRKNELRHELAMTTRAYTRMGYFCRCTRPTAGSIGSSRRVIGLAMRRCDRMEQDKQGAHREHESEAERASPLPE